MFLRAFEAKGLTDRKSDIPKLSQHWRDGYSEYNKRMSSGAISSDEFETIDVVHRRLLDSLVKEFSLDNVWSKSELDEMNLIWHHLKPWPDTVQGIDNLKKVSIVATLSNGNMRLLVDQAKFGDLHWDMLLSSELFKSAKPNPKVYLGACSMLLLKPEEVCMVACHRKDLEGAKKCGLRTAYIHRPKEDSGKDPAKEPYIDYVISEIGDLAKLIVP